MPDTQQQFDGQNPVPGYTLFHGKDGQNFYLKGENLADDEVKSRVAKLRGQSAPEQAPQGPTQFEQNINSQRGVTSAYDPNAQGIARRFLGSAGASLLSAPGAIIKAGMDPVGTAKDIVSGVGSSLKAYADPKTRPTLEGIESVLPEALGGGVGAVASGYAPEVAGAAYQGVRSAAYTPEGVPKPIVSSIGSALQHPTEIPGKMIGGTAKILFPPPKGSPIYDMPRVQEELAMRRLQPDAFAPPEPEIGSPDNPGFMSKLPARLPRNLRGDPFAPHVEDTAEAGRQAGGASNSGVMLVPEPRAALPSDRPGAAWSLDRTEGLPEAAMRGQPGALDVMRQLRPTLVVPSGSHTIGASAPSLAALRDSLGITGNPDPFSPPVAAVPRGNTSPFSPTPPSATEGWFRPTVAQGNPSPSSPVFVPADRAIALRRSKAAADKW